MNQWRGSWLFRVSWFVRLLGAKGSQALPVISTVEAQLSLYDPNTAKESRSTRNWNPEPRSEITLMLQYSVSHKRAP